MNGSWVLGFLAAPAKRETQSVMTLSESKGEREPGFSGTKKSIFLRLLTKQKFGVERSTS